MRKKLLSALLSMFFVTGLLIGVGATANAASVKTPVQGSSAKVAPSADSDPASKSSQENLKPSSKGESQNKTVRGGGSG